jgi:hypothetical protein
VTFTHDIFISYGHLDDDDPAGDVKGWVDLLVERLPRLISNNLGYQPKIWRDERSLLGNDLLRAAIDEGIARSLVFIPIVSPRYVQSDWCSIELDRFCNTASPPGAPAHRSRIFKVIKTPLLLHLANKEPEQLRELIGYSFFEMEADMPVEFSPDVVPSKDQRYWTALRRLAWDVSNMLVALKHHPESLQSARAAVPVKVEAPTISPVVAPVVTDSAASAGTIAVAPNGANGLTKSVYLAETTSDLTQERELVRDELRQRGYGVLPEQKLPYEEMKQTEQAVRAALARCALSVHLIGRRYGLTPEDDARSVVRIQEELAVQRGGADPAFLRLLWMPQGLMTPALEISDERQRIFVTELQNRITTGAELLQTSIEDLKTRIVEKLNPSPKTPAVRGVRSKLKQVYLICENRDRSLVRPIKEHLFKQSFEVITWFDEDVAGTLTDYHRKNLRECDAALVYFGSADEPWVRKNLEDLEKAYGYGREHDWSASAVYVGAPPNEQKEDFLTHMVPYVIRNYSSFDPNDLRDFVSAVQAAEGGQR